MDIKNKPIESLKMQAKSFLNYSKKNDKYKQIIYELMCMDDEDFEKNIQNTEEIKSFLISKGIQEELINNFENDYKKYILSDKYYYGPTNEYPENIREAIKKNDELMKQIKWLILSISNKKCLLNIPEFTEKTIQLKTRDTDKVTENDYSLISETVREIHKYYRKLINNIIKSLKTGSTTSEIIRETNENIKKYIIEIKDIIENLPYQLDSNTREYFIETINKFFDWNVIKKVLIEKYISLYFHGNTDIDSLRRKNGYIPTIYTKNIFDTQILQEILKGDCKPERITDKLGSSIDNEFLDDTFIHQSSFRVLEDIITEGGLISSNELVRRSKNNDRINRTKNNYPTAHIDKDIFFTRGFTNFEYGHSDTLEDVVYYANTMRQFGSKGYSIPINADTQNSYSTEIGSTKDSYGYSIISKNALEDENSYSKIDINDLFIFVHESKKQTVDQILSNLGSKEKNTIHITYIPDDIYPRNPIYKTNNTYRITEFIRNFLDTHINNKPKIRPINKTDRDRIIESNFHNIDVRYNIRAECECIGEEDCPKKQDELKDTNDELLSKIYQKYFGKDININPEIFNKIGSINSHIGNYPPELIKFSAMLIGGKIDEWDEKLKNFFIFLRKEGYSQKNLSILGFIHDFMLLANRTREISNKEKYGGLGKFCNNWDINYQDMKKFLIDLGNILGIETVGEVIGLQEKGKLISNHTY